MSYRLRVNPITCDAHGVCAELLPEFIKLDPWGYPIVPRADLPADLVEHARLAAAARLARRRPGPRWSRPRPTRPGPSEAVSSGSLVVGA